MTLWPLLDGRDPDSVVAIDSGAGPSAGDWAGAGDAGAGDAVVTTARLRERALSVAGTLRQAGVGRGDCVAVWLPNWSDALAWQFGAAALGAHVIGVNTRYNVGEVRHVLRRAQPKVVAIAEGFHGLDLSGRLRQALSEDPGLTAPVTVPVSGPGGTPAHPGAVDGADGEGDELAVAFTTSGSTGAPKLAAHGAAAVVEHARRDAEAIGIRPGDVVLCALPLSGVFGFNTAMAAIAGGGTCLLEPVFDERAVLADMARWRVAHAAGGDDMIGRLADAWRGTDAGAGADPGTRADLSSWRWLGIADFAGRAHEVAEWALREFGTQTSGLYGSSEVFALTALWPPAEPAPRRWGGGGRLVSPRMEARVVDGELQLRGPNVVDAYLGDPGAGSFAGDGWFRTGDLAEIDDDGAITFICRMGDALRLRGFLVDPAEIEQRLAEHESVRTAKVVGVRGAGGDEAVGFVVADGDLDGETLRTWCAATLAHFKVPVAIYVIDEMPVTSGTNGTKIKAATLREWARDLRKSNTALPEVTGVPQRKPARLREHAHAVRPGADGDLREHPSVGGGHRVDDAVVPAAPPHDLAVRGHPAHVRRAAAGDPPLGQELVVGHVEDGDRALAPVGDEQAPAVPADLEAVGAVSGGDELQRLELGGADEPDTVRGHVGDVEDFPVGGQPNILRHAVSPTGRHGRGGHGHAEGVPRDDSPRADVDPDDRPAELAAAERVVAVGGEVQVVDARRRDVHRVPQLHRVRVAEVDPVQRLGHHHGVLAVGGEVEVVGVGDLDRRPGVSGDGADRGQGVAVGVVRPEHGAVPGRGDVVRFGSDRKCPGDPVGGRVDLADRVADAVRHVDAEAIMCPLRVVHAGRRMRVHVHRGRTVGRRPRRGRRQRPGSRGAGRSRGRP
jgi:acyl-CoA synthetase (AMP-forming)/AMP-acid ligase II